MSELNQIFQNRSNVSSSTSSYSPIRTFREMLVENNSTVSSGQTKAGVSATPSSPMELGLSLALLDKEIFDSKELSRKDISFLSSINASMKKKKSQRKNK